MTSTTTDLPSYDPRTVRLHWLTAALVLLLWLAAHAIDFFPKGTPRVTARSLHITVGVGLGLLLVLRLRWRLGGGTRLPGVGSAGMQALATWMHRGLYALLIAVVVAGMANVWVRGDNLYNLVKVPAFDPNDKALRETVGELHEWLANILLMLAALHGAAGLYHRFVLKDGVLRRMVPSSSAPG